MVDADLISRACTQPGGAALPDIVRTFGEAYLAADGSLDRARMRERIFADPPAKAALEAIVHPRVAEGIARQVQASRAALLVFDIPLLVESQHWRKQLDRVLVVDCPRQLQIERVVRRSGLSPSAVENIIDSQSPRLRRAAAADALVYNSFSRLDELHQLLDDCAHWFGL